VFWFEYSLLANIARMSTDARFAIPSHDRKLAKSHDIELLSKRSREFNENRVGLKGGDWLHYPAHRKLKIPQAFWANLQIFGGERFSKSLPIMFTLGNAKM
jgi:hypothetical protein